VPFHERGLHRSRKSRGEYFIKDLLTHDVNFLGFDLLRSSFLAQIHLVVVLTIHTYLEIGW